MHEPTLLLLLLSHANSLTHSLTHEHSTTHPHSAPCLVRLPHIVTTHHAMPCATHRHTLQSFTALALSPHTGPGVDVPPFCTAVELSRRLQIIAFGDSLTQQAAFPDGWYTLLFARYQRRADLFNRGYSGYTTRNALTTLKQHTQAGIWPQHVSDTASSRIKRLVIVWLGSNDSCTHFSSMPNMHVPLPAFKANMTQIIHTLLADRTAATTQHQPTQAAMARPPQRATALLLLTPLDQSHWLAYRHRKYRQQLGPLLPSAFPPMEYVEAVKALGAEYSVGVCDVSGDEVLGATNNEEWSVDGVHLNAEGNKRVFQAVVAAIERNWSELAVERLPLDAEAVSQLS